MLNEINTSTKKVNPIPTRVASSPILKGSKLEASNLFTMMFTLRFLHPFMIWERDQNFPIVYEHVNSALLIQLIGSPAFGL